MIIRRILNQIAYDLTEKYKVTYFDGILNISINTHPDWKTKDFDLVDNDSCDHLIPRDKYDEVINCFPYIGTPEQVLMFLFRKSFEDTKYQNLYTWQYPSEIDKGN